MAYRKKWLVTYNGVGLIGRIFMETDDVGLTERLVKRFDEIIQKDHPGAFVTNVVPLESEVGGRPNIGGYANVLPEPG